MTRVPDYTGDERNIIENTVNTRWKKDPVEIRPADVEVPPDSGLPGSGWQVGAVSSLSKAVKTAANAASFTGNWNRWAPGSKSMAPCNNAATTVLQTQADYERVRNEAFSEKPYPKT